MTGETPRRAFRISDADYAAAQAAAHARGENLSTAVLRFIREYGQQSAAPSGDAVGSGASAGNSAAGRASPP